MLFTKTKKVFRLFECSYYTVIIITTTIIIIITLLPNGVHGIVFW